MYTKELIDEVKEMFPDYERMHELAESGSAWLGRYLDDSCVHCIHIDHILKATSLEQLVERARLEKRKVELYRKWQEQDPRRK